MHRFSWLWVSAVILFCLSPLIGMLQQIQKTHFVALLEPAFFKSLWITFSSSAAGSLFACLLGLYFAKIFALHSWRTKRLQKLMILFPYLIPNFVLAIAFVIAWNPSSGLLNRFLKFPSGLYGLSGMIALFAIVHFPVTFLLLEEKFLRIDSSLREAARMAGASPWKIFLKIELPLLKSSLLASFGLCFALNISAFAIPAWIGAPAHLYPLTYKIYQAIQVEGLEGIPQAATYSLVLFILTLLPIFVARDKKFALLTGKSSRPTLKTFSTKSFFTFQTILFVSQLLFWILPLLCLLATTLTKPGCLQMRGFECFADVSLERYFYVLFELEETKSALFGSLIYGSLSSLIIMFTSVLTLLLLTQNKRALSFVEGTFQICLSTPGALIALGAIVVYSGKYGINLYNTAWIAVVAYVIKHLSLAFQPLKTGFANISPSLIEAAQLSGATQRKKWQKIILPILKPEILGAFFFVLIPILGELTMSVFLASPKFKSIGTVMFDLQDYADQGAAAALAIILILLTLILNECSRLLSRGKLGF